MTETLKRASVVRPVTCPYCRGEDLSETERWLNAVVVVKIACVECEATCMFEPATGWCEWVSPRANASWKAACDDADKRFEEE